MKKQNVPTQPPECCPRFNPAPWDGKIVKWEKKRFIKDNVFTLFYIPVNFGSVITKMNALLEKNGTEMIDGLCLSDCISMWNMDLYLAVDKEIPGAHNTQLSGMYLCKVYEGDFKDTGAWCKDFVVFAKEKGFTAKKMYMWYTTCPKCAKNYGKNYVVIVGKV
jgi:hypothetical protein